MDKLSDEQLDQLLAGIQTPGQVDALYSKLLQRVINRSLEAEMDVHLGYSANEKSPSGRRSNSRNGKTTKTIKGTFGEVKIETPRDRDGSFQPQLIPKRQVRLDGLDEKILALFARGMTTRDIASAMQDLYGVEVSHTLISQVTDSVLDELRAWQNRPLDSIYPILWLDGIQVKVRSGKQVENRSAHVVLGVDMHGHKEVLGIWMAQNEGAKFWHSVLTELRNRGVQDVYIACMDGLKGLPEAVNAVFPKTLTQLCVVHLVRASLRYVNASDTKGVVGSLKAIYQSASEEEAAVELDALEAAWGGKYRAVVRIWRGNWADITPFFAFPPEIRKVVYTTNAIESLNMSLRKLTRNRRIFPNDDGALKSLYLAVREASKKWGQIHHWKQALQSFQILFGEDRVPV
ncbi:MAG: IS256 family transposase [Fibrobacteres bacterium]|jgi:transposase-like protein|nr:IS256 family transposase [Fibrobacterota bacterium]